MSNKKQIKISQQDLKTIYGDDYSFFKEKILPNCFCSKCATSHTSTIIDYRVFLNDLNDIVLKGFCAKCASKMTRYVETGEVEKYQGRIKKIRKDLEKKGSYTRVTSATTSTTRSDPTML